MKKFDLFKKIAHRKLISAGAIRVCTFKSTFDGVAYVFRDEEERIIFHCQIDPCEESKVFSIFGRFAEPKKEVGNPYSGKYNLHYLKKTKKDDFCDDLDDFIENLKTAV